MTVKNINTESLFLSDISAFVSSIWKHGWKLLLEGGIVGVIGLLEHFEVKISAKDFAIWWLPLIAAHAFWLAFTDQRRQTELQGKVVRCEVDSVGENYIRLHREAGNTLDGFTRLALLVEAGIMQLKDVPNSVQRVHDYIVSKNTPGPLCDGWGGEKLFFSSTKVIPFLQWALPKSYMLRRNIDQIWDQYSAAELQTALNPQMDKLPCFPTLDSTKPDSGHHGPAIRLC